VTERIKVHEKALAHLSKGLYRSPASAIRELVSNAWDANATRVDIMTSAPIFSQIVVTDNGNGFRAHDFAELMRGGIGNSAKRDRPEADEGTRRPILGRLGIGLMGVAQICTRFQVFSQTNSGEGFAAEVRIENSLRRKLDENDPSFVSPSPGDDVDGARDVFIGEWDLLKPPAFDRSWHGTQIVITDPNPSFVASFVKTLRPISSRIDEQPDEMADRVDRLDFPTPEQAEEAMPPRDWKKTLQLMAKKESVTMRGAYWRFLWELAAACPVAYLTETSVPGGCVKTDQARLVDNKFAVYVDGRELRKPVHFPKRENGYSTLKFERDAVIEGRPLRFHGYLLVQDGSQLRPAEIRGIQIRIKDVGVGYYDGTLLDWQVNQGPRSRWVSGEVFVEQGLEDAMNVDRDSFNRFHPEFMAVQAAVHAQLKQVFTGVYRKLSERSEATRASRDEARLENASEILKKFSSKPIRVKEAQPPRANTDTETHVSDVVVDSAKGLTVYLSAATKLPIRREQRVLAQSIIALFELVHRERSLSSSARRQKFVDGILELLSKW
jgi:hypothetical protein